MPPSRKAREHQPRPARSRSAAGQQRTAWGSAPTGTPVRRTSRSWPSGRARHVLVRSLRRLPCGWTSPAPRPVVFQSPSSTRDHCSGLVTRRGWMPGEQVLTMAQICSLTGRARDPRYRPVQVSRAPAPPRVVFDRLQAVRGARATVASVRRPASVIANTPGVQPHHGGQQPPAVAQVRGHSREPAFRARPVEFSFGVAVQQVERYIAARIPRVCGEQIIQPRADRSRGLPEGPRDLFDWLPGGRAGCGALRTAPCRPRSG